MSQEYTKAEAHREALADERAMDEQDAIDSSLGAIRTAVWAFEKHHGAIKKDHLQAILGSVLCRLDESATSDIPAETVEALYAIYDDL